MVYQSVHIVKSPAKVLFFLKREGFLDENLYLCNRKVILNNYDRTEERTIGDSCR
jgi:hypothetical protein